MSDSSSNPYVPHRRALNFLPSTHNFDLALIVRWSKFLSIPVLDWIAAVTAHIPNNGEHLVRYYGWYSNVNRGKRKKAEEQA